MSDKTEFDPRSGTLRPATLLRHCEPGYEAPTADDVRAALEVLNMSVSEASRIVGRSPRSVRKWMTEPDSPNYQPMSYAAWRLLLLETGLVHKVGGWENPAE